MDGESMALCCFGHSRTAVCRPSNFLFSLPTSSFPTPALPLSGHLVTPPYLSSRAGAPHLLPQ